MKQKQPSLLLIILKLIAIALLSWLLLSVAIFAFQAVADHNDYLWNKADKMESCDYYYHHRNYGLLRKWLEMNKLDGPEFEKYNEAANGFEDYQTYLQYSKAVNAGMTDAEDLMNEYRQRVIANADHCAYEENRQQLEAYAAQL